ncbi:MAG: type II secretion system protein GspE, partial [Deltaproteobacteria bacterium]|nr:type II secretion system protein GspE [Deltaproteobacteria bacterium]
MEAIEKKIDGMRFFAGMLVKRGLAAEKDVEKAVNAVLEKGGDFTEALINAGGMSEDSYLGFLAEYLGLGYLDKIPVDEINIEILKKIPITFLKSIYALPLRIEDSRVLIAVADPFDLESLNELGIVYNKRIEPVLASKEKVFDGINRIFDRISGLEGTAGDIFSDEDLGTISKEIEESTKDLLDVTDEAPIIKLVNSVLTQAVKEKSSDIHVEPFEKFLSVRFRKDGVL